MPTISSLLREAHRLRKHLVDLRTEIERGPRVLKAHQTKLSKIEDEFRAGQDHIKKLQLQIRDHEGSFKTTNQQLTKYEAKLEKVSNQKEFDATTHEITHAKKETARLEEAILNGMTELEEKTAQLPELEKKLQTAKTDFATYEKDSQVRHARLVQDVQASEAKLKETEAEIPEKIRPHYDRMVTAYKESAMAGAKSKVCQHCHTSITSTQQIDLEGGGFICCTSCGRMLYLAD